jgi:hypothetical protein
MKIIWIETKYKNYPINSENFVYLLTISLGLLNTHDTVITCRKKNLRQNRVAGYIYRIHLTLLIASRSHPRNTKIRHNLAHALQPPSPELP